MVVKAFDLFSRKTTSELCRVMWWGLSCVEFFVWFCQKTCVLSVAVSRVCCCELFHCSWRSCHKREQWAVWPVQVFHPWPRQVFHLLWSRRVTVCLQFAMSCACLHFQNADFC